MTGIFKAYDIRGIYPKDLNEDTAYKVGKALVTLLKCKNVAVGRDMRTSSEPLFQALAKGITESGADVVDLGMITTPMLYFAVGHFGYEAGISLTASHNPAQYNGFKFVKKGSVPISYDTGINKIELFVKEGKFDEPGTTGKVIKEEKLADEYRKFVTKGVKKFPFKAVIDTANAMGVKEADIITDYVDFFPLYFVLDPTFPHHEANPIKFETLKDLQKQVLKEKANIGIAFDGDADRIGFVDEKGQIVSGDLIIALLARRFKGMKIGYEPRSSWAVPEEIKKNGGTPVKLRVGHVFIKQAMRKENIEFAGEGSGHYYYKDNFFCESSIKTVFLVLDIMHKEKKKLSELIAPIKRYFHTGEINFEVRDKDAVLERVKKKYLNTAKNIHHIDGVTVEFVDWWCNVRKSNTEPLVRLNLEAKSKELMEEKKKEVSDLIGA